MSRDVNFGIIYRLCGWVLFAATIVLVTPNEARAAQPEIVASIAALNSGNWGSYPVLTLSSYYAGGSAGGGTLVYMPSDTTSATDSCVIFLDNAGHRFYRQLSGKTLDVTMCGAHWDNATDDASAINAAYVAANRIGSALSCPGGTGKIGSTITPQPGVILRCQGMEVSFINGSSVSGPCFYLQNANGTVEVQAPAFYGFSLTCGGTFGIQLNSVAGGFTDTPATQNYMTRPRLENVEIVGGSTAAFQCSKCFDGDISLSKFNGGGMGVDLEGSDWMSVGSKGANRFVSQSNYPIAFVGHYPFGNGDVADHNDILSVTSSHIGAYIYSSAASSIIKNNFLESVGGTSGACEIKLDTGTLVSKVMDNLVTDFSVANWLCVPSLVVALTATGNQTTNGGGGGALFSAGSGSHFMYNTILRQAILHSGNFREDGFPFNTQAPGNSTFGPRVMFDATPSTAENIDNADYAGSLLIKNNAYVLPAAGSFATLIDFTAMARTITGTVDACLYASSTVNGTSISMQYLDGGVPQANQSYTLSTIPKWYCWAGLTPSTAATFKVWNSDTTNNGNDYLYELSVTQH